MTKETTQSAPVVSPEEGVARLQDVLAQGKRLLQKPTTSEQLSAFQLALNGALVEAFGAQSDWTHRTNTAGTSIQTRRLAVRNPAAARHEEIKEKVALIAECIGQLKRMSARRPVATAPIEPTALITVEKILSQFHKVARHLRNRRDTRPPLKMEDEYDVQYLLHALLLVSFRDVRAEETGPSRAGSRPRLDFLLKDERIVIEVKKTRPSLTDKEIGDELLADIGRYKGHPDCKTLVCFVYDPDDQIKNAAAIIRDLEEQSSAELQVRALVVPHH